MINVLVLLLVAIFPCRCQETEVNNVLQSKLPFLQTAAEFWSFNNQIEANMRAYSSKIQNYTKYFFIGRKQNVARLASLSHDLEIKVSGGRILPFELNLRDGLLRDLSDVHIEYDGVTKYQELEVVYESGISFSKDLKIVHDFTIKRGGTGFKGKILGLVKDLHYKVSTRFNLATGKVNMDEFKPRCFGGLEVNVTGLPKNRAALIDKIENVAMRFYKDSIMEDAETLTHTALDEAFAGESISEYLPKFNYSTDYGKGVKKYERPKQVEPCPENSKTTTTALKIKFIIVTHLGRRPFPPFILNGTEMLAFELLMKESANSYAEDFLSNAIQNLIARDLGRARIRDVGRKFKGTDSLGMEKNGSIRFKNGWISSLYEFINDRVELIEINGYDVVMTWRVHLNDGIEFEQDFEAKIARNSHKGSVKVKLESMSYLLRLKTDLQTFNAEIMDFYLECKGLEKVEVSGLGAMHDRLVEGISNEAKAVFNEYALDVVGKLLIQALESAKYSTNIQSYLPNWNYKRDFTNEQDGDVSMPTFKTCEAFYLKMLEGKGFDPNYSAVVTPNAVPFIENTLELRSFGEKLKVGLNKYMDLILHEAGSLAVIRGMSKFKLPDFKFALNYKDDLNQSWGGDWIMKNNWVEGISGVYKRPDVIDHIRFNRDNIFFTAEIPLWLDIEFTTDFTANVNSMTHKGDMRMSLLQSYYLFGVRVDYIDSPKVTVNTYKLKCIKQMYFQIEGLEGFEQWSLKDEMANVIDKTLVSKVMKEVEILFRRLLHDAISNNDVRNFLPDWNYTRVYTRDPSPAQPVTYYRLCVNAEPDGPKIASIYTNETYIEYENFIKIIRTEALRKYMKKNNPESMLYYANQAWIWSTNIIIDRYLETKLPDHSRLFVAKDRLGEERSVNLRLTKGTSSGLSEKKKFKEIDIAYAKNNQVVALATETFPEIVFKYDFEIYISDKFEGNGTVEGKAINVKNMMKFRADWNTKTFVIEDYQMYCLFGATTTAMGLTPENEWLEKYIEEQALIVFTGPILYEVADLRGRILKDVEQKAYVNGKYALPSWIISEKMFQIAISNETHHDRISKRKKMMSECITPQSYYTDEKHMEYEGNLPFILMEAEWWYFDAEMKYFIKRFISESIASGYTFIKDHEFSKLSFPEYGIKFAAKSPDGSLQSREVKFRTVAVEDLSTIIFSDVSSNIEFEGIDAILTSYVKFSEKIKFLASINAKLGDIMNIGVVEGTVESLTYAFRTRINLKTRRSNLEDVQLSCIGEVKTVTKGLGGPSNQLYEMVQRYAKDMFVGPILDDVSKIIHLSLEWGVGSMRPEITFVPQWNYDLDYSKRRQPDSDSDSESAHYNACTPTSHNVPNPGRIKDDSITFFD